MKKRKNQLEESYHFKEELGSHSFIYKGKKAFILNINENITLISSFMKYRKELSDRTNLIHQNKSVNFDDYYKFLLNCMGIIGNMLDDEKMGSITAYLDHIWNGINKIIENKDITNFAKAVGEISDIITMIDFVTEKSLNKIDQSDIKLAIAQAAINEYNPNLEVLDVLEITDDGSIKRLKIKQSEMDKPESKEQQYDLKHMIPLNTKEI